MIWILILSLIINIFLIVVTYYALNKINQYENFILQFSQIINFATEKMKQVDSAGHYESDDETGFFFEQLKQIQVLMNNLFENTGEEDAEKKEK
tara:strand:- start:1055 stop:1336 length:282 start_codon:yes stop_codon:yes gene_type:complete